MRMLRLKQEIMDDDEKGKLFVGGLSWETTQDNLQRYFSRYGEVIDCVVMKNAESGRSRGFGFVTFADPANVNVVLQNGPHTLDGRTIDPKPCNPRTLQKPKKGGGYPKVFLGGLPSNVTETDLRSFFTRFGKVMEVVIMYDQEKKKSRGFGFLSFEDDEAVDRCVSEHFVNLNGKQVEIKKAEPRDGSGGGKMSMGGGMGGDPSSAWGPPQPPMGMMQAGGPNGQMGGPPMNLAAAGPMGPNMMQGYQGWGAASAAAAHQQQAGYAAAAAAAGYGAPSGGPPAGYQGWGAPAAPQGPPHQWGGQAAGYGGPPPPPQQQGYGQYGEYGPSAGSGAASWNSWNMPQNSGSTGPSGYMAGDMYSRGGSGAPATPGAAPNSTGGGGGSKSGGGSDYGGGYGAYGGGYSDGGYGGGGGGGAPPRSYGGGSDAGSQVGGYTSGAAAAAAGYPSGAGDNYVGGPHRGSGYANSLPYHPYRR